MTMMTMTSSASTKTASGGTRSSRRSVSTRSVGLVEAVSSGSLSRRSSQGSRSSRDDQRSSRNQRSGSNPHSSSSSSPGRSVPRPDSKHVAVLSRRCSISEILDLATTMIISMINNGSLTSSDDQDPIALVAASPKGIPKLDGIIEQEESLGDSQDNPILFRKKVRKTIRDFNPNPLLLSKKAVKTRKLKLKSQREENDGIFDENEHLQNEVNPLGGKLWEIVKTNSLVSKFDSNETVNSIKLPPLKITNSEQPIRILGSRQKQLTKPSPTPSLPRQDPVSLSSLIRSTNSKTLTGEGVSDSSGVPSPPKTSRVLGSRQQQLLRGAPAAQPQEHLEPRQQLGAGGIGTYLRRQDAARWRQQEQVARRRHKPKERARVRKVLKGRRKLSSAEFRKRQTK